MKIEELAEFLSFEQKDGFPTGRIGEFDAYISLYRQEFMKMPVLVIPLDRIFTREDFKFLKENLKLNGLRLLTPINFGMVNKPYIAAFVGKTNFTKLTSMLGEALQNDFNALSAILLQMNFKSTIRCAVCDQEMSVPEYEIINDSMANGLGVIPIKLLAHHSCMSQVWQENTQVIEEENSHTERYPMAYFLAIVFMIVAIGVNYGILLGLNYLIGVAYALIGLGGMWGFQLSKAPFTKLHILIISIIATVLFVGSFLILMGLLAAISNITFAAVLSDSAVLIFQMLLFFGIGLVFAIQVMWRNTKEYKLKRYGNENSGK
jgi:hypothetical protein